MGNKTRLLTLVGFCENGMMTFITDDNGDAEPGRRAWIFNKDEAKNMVNALLENGVKNACMVCASAEGAKAFYNPEIELAISDDVISTLLRCGFKKWVRGGKYRLYYEDDFSRVTYIDCLTGKVHGRFAGAVNTVENLLVEAVEECNTKRNDDNMEVL